MRGAQVRRIVLVAEDCPVDIATAPAGRGTGPTVAQVQHELVSADPYVFTEDDVLFESWWRRQEGSASASEDERARIRAEYLGRPRPCLRASPLPSRWGWGLVFDDQDRVALCPVESPEYAALAAGDGGVEVQKSFRRTRRPSSAGRPPRSADG